MLQFLLSLVGVVIAATSSAGEALRVSALTGPGLIPNALIVGRAPCLGTSWLLTEEAQLIEISSDGRSVGIHRVSGLTPEESVWGLGCLSDGSLWTLASARTVARLDRSGRIQERIGLKVPRVALFGTGDRLLYQALPMTAGALALATSPPRQPESVRAWPGLVARAAGTQEQRLARNLANCGLGFERWMACWFPDDTRFSRSDGSASRTVELPALRAAAFDQTAPIWDIALSAGDRFWLLASSRGRQDDRRAGRRLFLMTEKTGTTVSIAVDPPARLIVAAGEFRCLLVTTAGSVAEVVVMR
jgi:hypothetical protein